MNPRNISRRAMLRGGAVALSLPWLESLAARAAKAAGAAGATASPVRRYINMYMPNGTTDLFWLPGAGTSASTPKSAPAGPFGTAAVSAILEPLAPSNKYMLLLGGVGNYSAYGGGNAQPSHGTNCGPSFHGWDSRYGMKDNGVGITDALQAAGSRSTRSSPHKSGAKPNCLRFRSAFRHSTRIATAPRAVTPGACLGRGPTCPCTRPSTRRPSSTRW